LTVDSLEGLPSIGAICSDCARLFQHHRNCIKFTPDGGSIYVAGQHVLEPGGDGAVGGYVEVTIRDTGIGIDPEDGLIFEKPHCSALDLHSTGSPFKGRAAWVRRARCDQAHGGVWSGTGHDEVSFPSSTFHILLPASEPAAWHQSDFIPFCHRADPSMRRRDVFVSR
jgi:hypothetical protein